MLVDLELMRLHFEMNLTIVGVHFSLRISLMLRGRLNVVRVGAST